MFFVFRYVLVGEFGFGAMEMGQLVKELFILLSILRVFLWHF
jgi:hypothetical protein